MEDGTICMTEQCWHQRAVNKHHVQMTDSAVDWVTGCTEPAETVYKWYIAFTGATKRLCIKNELVDFDTLWFSCFSHRGCYLCLSDPIFRQEDLNPRLSHETLKITLAATHILTTYKILLFIIFGFGIRTSFTSFHYLNMHSKTTSVERRSDASAAVLTLNMSHMKYALSVLTK